MVSLLLAVWAWVAAEMLATFEPVKALPHEGQAKDGLRLHVKARFLPEEDAWGAPKLETTFTFTNETDKPIVLNAYSLYYRLTLSRLAPLDGVKTSQERPPIVCGIPEPDEKDILRIPPRGKYVHTKSRWCDTLSIPHGVSIGGEVFDAKTYQYFKLLRPGRLTLAFVYRSDGPVTAEKELAKFLKPGERLWSGRVYSNAVRINVKLHVQKP